MTSEAATLLSVDLIGNDVLSLRQSVVQIISDLLNGGGYGGGGGAVPPGQYPLG